MMVNQKIYPAKSFRVRAICEKKAQLEVSHYFIGHKIGHGGYSSVHKAIEKLTNAQLAVKIIDLKLFNPNIAAKFRQEVEILKAIDHPNIIKIYEFIQEDSKLYIFMELIKGQELFQYVRQRGPLPEQKAANIFQQVCKAVKYLHTNGIVHRDIKAENIVIDANSNAKLIDFGLAKKFNLQSKDLLFTICGSPSYTSPEILARRRYDGQKVDIWCLGVTLYTMLQAKLPFDQEGDEKTQQNIYRLAWDKPDFSSTEAIEVYKSVFVKQQERPGIDDILVSPLLKKHSGVDKRVDIKKNTSELAVKKVADLLNQSVDKVKEKVNDRQLGLTYCIYNLINDKLQNQSRSYQTRTVFQNLNGAHQSKYSSKKTEQNLFLTPKVSTDKNLVLSLKKRRTSQVKDRSKVSMKMRVLNNKDLKQTMRSIGNKDLKQQTYRNPPPNAQLMFAKFLNFNLT